MIHLSMRSKQRLIKTIDIVNFLLEKEKITTDEAKAIRI